MNTDFAKALKSLIPAYLANRRSELDAIEAAIERSDFEQLKIIGHQMKGHGPSYGFPALGQIGLKIEVASKAQDLEGLRNSAKELKDFLDNEDSV